MLRAFLILLSLVLILINPAQAATAEQEVQTSWRLLDYIGVDYREAVASGKIINQVEYDEMLEFSSTVANKVRALPAKPAKAQLIAGARDLETAIAANPARLMHYIELGRTYARMGRTSEARKLIEKGLAMPNIEKDDPEVKARGRETLAGLN